MEKNNRTTFKKSSRGRTPTGQPNPIDVHVGNRIRLRRALLGLSQEKLGSMLGLTFQQVQKYERGMNRVGASRLWDIAKVLEVPIGFFFADMDKSIAEQSPRMFVLNDDCFSKTQEIDDEKTDPMQKAEVIEIVKDYLRIPNRNLARCLKDSIHQASKTAYSNSKDDEISEE